MLAILFMNTTLMVTRDQTTGQVLLSFLATGFLAGVLYAGGFWGVLVHAAQ